MKPLTFTVEARVCAEWNDDGPTHAVISLGKKAAERILQLHQATHELNVAAISEYDYTPDFKVNQGAEDELDLVEWTEGSEDAMMLNVNKTGFYWSGYLKHTEGTELETTEIDVEEMREQLKVATASLDSLPLYINILKYDSAISLLERRMKGKA
jgi:hypothetical protein